LAEQYIYSDFDNVARGDARGFVLLAPLEPVDDPLRIASKEAFDAMASLGPPMQCLKVADSSRAPEKFLPADMLGPKPRKHWKRKRINGAQATDPN
jgi:hypothetical protein